MAKQKKRLKTRQSRSVVETTNQSKPSNKRVGDHTFPFNKWNFIWMGIGLVLIIVGYVMMYDSDGKDIFAPERITYPTILVMLGYAVEAYAILARFGKSANDSQHNEAG